MKRIIFTAILFFACLPVALFAQTITHNWDFNGAVSGGAIDGWQLLYYGNASASNGLLTVTTADPASANPPRIINTLSSAINTSITKYMYIRMRNNTNETSARFSWYVNSVWYSVDFPIGANDTDIKEYTIDLSSNASWTGSVASIAFRLPNLNTSTSNGKTVIIDYIRGISKAAMTSRNPAPFGVNLSGAEFGSVPTAYPGVLGTNYGYPTSTDLDYFYNKGFRLVRLPFRWERVQRTVNGTLYQDDMLLIRNFILQARARGMWVIPDLHNYNRRYWNGAKDSIGTSTLPVSTIEDLWYRLASEWKIYDNIYGYGIMNEPNNMPTSWYTIAQAIINKIRTTDTNTPVIVGGDDWSSAYRWVQVSDNLKNLSDVSDKLIYEAHVYFDKGTGGSYGLGGYDNEEAKPYTGVRRLAPFVKWLKDNNKQGIVGEYGIPDNDSRWNTVLDNALFFLKENGIGGTYWSAGPRWPASEPLAVQPVNGTDRPQMPTLLNYKFADTYSSTFKDTRSNVHYWEFSSPVINHYNGSGVITGRSVESWNINDYANPVSSGGLLSLSYTTPWSILYYDVPSNLVAINTAVHKYLIVKVRNATAYTSAVFKFTANGTVNTKSFSITAGDAAIKQYVVDLSAIAGWAGNISVIQVGVPYTSATPSTAQTVVFDEIKLATSVPAGTVLLNTTRNGGLSLDSGTAPAFANELVLSPNPVENSVQLHLNTSGRVVDLSVHSIAGELIWRGKGRLEQLNQSLNSRISVLPAGIYVMKIADKGQVYQTKMLKR